MAYGVIREKRYVYITGSVSEIRELKKVLSSNSIEFYGALIHNPPSAGVLEVLNVVGTWVSVGLSAASLLHQMLSPKGSGKELKKELRKALRKPASKRK